MTPNPLPDPNPHPPRLPLPPGACDCHAHVFGPPDRYPLIPHPGYVPAPVTFDDYLRMQRAIGVTRGVLVQPSPYGADHAALLDALRSGRFPLRGVALYHDTLTDRHLEELHYYGVQGARLHLQPDNTEAVLKALPRTAERVRRFGWHLQFYVNLEQHADIDRLLLDLPVPVVIDHFGLVPAAGGTTARGFQTLLRLAHSGRCWLKLSAPYRISTQPPRFGDVIPLARALVSAAPDRCVWGTDWPHPDASFMPNDGDLVDELAAWIPDETLRRKVLVDNPTHLYGF
jgi:predicted TIM-barrel fold metal-dependent hydrolase